MTQEQLSKIQYLAESRLHGIAWESGVRKYIKEILAKAIELSGGKISTIKSVQDFRKFLLCNMRDARQYSKSGLSLTASDDIELRLCTLSELQKCIKGYGEPSSKEDWFEVQTRAIQQAIELLVEAYHTFIQFTAPTAIFENTPEEK